MKFNSHLICLVGVALAFPIAHAEQLATPGANRQVPSNMDGSEQMKVPEPVYDTRGEQQGAIRFDGTTDVKASATTAAAPTMSVREAQQNLNRFGYDLSVDGVMGGQTRSALREFQMSTGLMTTGNLNEATIDALRAQSSESFERAPASVEQDGMVIPPEQVNPAPAGKKRPNGHSK